MEAGRERKAAGVRRHWPVLVAAAVAAGLVLFLIWQRAELLAVVETVGEARAGWLLAAVSLQCLVYLNFAAVYERSLALLGYRVKLLSLYRVAFVAVFLGRVFPAGGTSTYAFLLYHLRRRGIPDGAGLVAVTLDGLSYLVAFFALLLGGFVYLFTHGELKANEIMLVALVVLAILFLVMYVWALHYNRPLLTRRALALKDSVARLLRRQWGDMRVLAFLAEIYDGLALIKRNPAGFVRLVAMQIGALLLDSLTLLALFLSLGTWPHLSVVLLGYSLAYFFSTLTSLPGGAGSFEATMALTFTQLGMPAEVALSVTLLYRLLAFWLPLVISASIYHGIRGPRVEPARCERAAPGEPAPRT